MNHFAAPWSTKLKLTTAAFAAFSVYVVVKAGMASGLVLGGLYLVFALLAVRGYSVTKEAVLIHRFGWAKRVDLASISAAEFSPGATLGSVRTWGLGGVLGFVGYFRNATLGTYRAYATDAAHTVVLTVGEETLVVTPERPAEFVAAVREAQQDVAV